MLIYSSQLGFTILQLNSTTTNQQRNKWNNIKSKIEHHLTITKFQQWSCWPKLFVTTKWHQNWLSFLTVIKLKIRNYISRLSRKQVFWAAKSFFILASVGYISEVKLPKIPVMNISHMKHAKFQPRLNRHMYRTSLSRDSKKNRWKVFVGPWIEPATLRSIDSLMMLATIQACVLVRLVQRPGRVAVW